MKEKGQRGRVTDEELLHCRPRKARSVGDVLREKRQSGVCGPFFDGDSNASSFVIVQIPRSDSCKQSIGRICWGRSGSRDEVGPG